MRIVALGFDDGFRKSSIAQAESFECFGLRACLNVLATPEELADGERRWDHDRGDFALWNELQARGHEIMPHSCRHEALSDMPFPEAQDAIRRCLDVFEEKLEGFDPKTSVFNYPWNTSTPELDAWLPSQVRAYRAGYGTVLPLPTRDTVRLPSAGYGDNDDASGFEVGLEELLAQPEGWLVWVAHGLDGEGWGPMSADYLKRLLDRLLSLGVEVLPAGVVLAQAT